jgi:hypothetical protein
MPTVAALVTAKSVAVRFAMESASGQMATRGSPRSVVSGATLWAVRTKRAVSIWAGVMALAARGAELVLAQAKRSSSGEA